MDRAWVEQTINHIAGLSRGGPGVTRLALSEEDTLARRYITSLMQEAGMTVRTDAIANIIGRLPGSDATAPPVIVGSHLDTVPEGGAYDGVLGVVGGLAAIKRVIAEGVTVNPLELIVFTAEESSRFGFGTMGSKAMGGTPASHAWIKAKDQAGVTFADALAKENLQFDRINEASRVGEPMKAFLELHIEQGPVLEKEGLSIGVVEAIAAPTRLKISVEGTAGHSGTTPMGDRQDALVSAAMIVLAIQEIATGHSHRGTVGTVGNLKVHPGVMNVIPGLVEMWVDIRGVDHESIIEVLQEVKDEISTIAETQGTPVAIEVLASDKPVSLQEEVVRVVEESTKATGKSYKRMNSGAGHDAMNMAQIVTAGMIFIPCKQGISHNPDEFADLNHVMDGIDVLAESIKRLAR